MKIRSQGDRPRLSVFRSNKYFYVQVIDDSLSKTIISVSSKNLKSKDKPLKIARELGLLVAKNALAAGLEKVVFDRGNYSYHGAVKALAEGAREGGLKF